MTSYGKKCKRKRFNEQSSESKSNKSQEDSKESQELHFKIASYNLLAPALVEENYRLYRSNNPTFMDWNYRKRRIIVEVKKINADVNIIIEDICFQI